MKLGRTCAAAAVLATVALPATAAVSWADTAPDQQPDETSQPAEQRPDDTRSPDARPAPDDAEAEGTRQAPASTPSPAEQRRSQVAERPAGAPDTGGGPAEWDATPAYAAGGAAAVAVAGVGTVLVLRRRHAGQR